MRRLLLVLIVFLLATSGATASTTASTNGALPLVVPGQGTVLLPDIIIREDSPGALQAGAYLALALPAYELLRFDISQASVRALGNDDNSDLTPIVLADPTLQQSRLNTGATLEALSLQLPPYPPQRQTLHLVISGLRAQVASCGNTNITALLGGSTQPADQLTSLAQIGSDQGARVTATYLQLSQHSSSIDDYGASCHGSHQFSGPLTAQTLNAKLSVPRQLYQQEGFAFVLALLPAAYQPRLFSLDAAGRWQSTQDCTDIAAAYHGPLLPDLPLDIVPTSSDLSALVGTAIYTGIYPDTADGTDGTVASACTSMLQQGYYQEITHIGSK